MEAKKLREKKIEELIKMREKLVDEISEVYLEMRIGKETNVRKPRAMRKDLALLETVIKEKESSKGMSDVQKSKLKDEKKNG